MVVTTSCCLRQLRIELRAAIPNSKLLLYDGGRSAFGSTCTVLWNRSSSGYSIVGWRPLPNARIASTLRSDGVGGASSERGYRVYDEYK